MECGHVMGMARDAASPVADEPINLGVHLNLIHIEICVTKTLRQASY